MATQGPGLLELLNNYERFFVEENPELASGYKRELFRAISEPDPTIRLNCNGDATRLNTEIAGVLAFLITPGALNKSELARKIMTVGAMSLELLGKGSRVYKWTLKCRETIINKERTQDDAWRAIRQMTPLHLKGDKVELYRSLEERNGRIETWKKSKMPRSKVSFTVLQSTKCPFSSRGLFDEFPPVYPMKERKRARTSSESSMEEKKKAPKSKYTYNSSRR